MKQFIVDTFTQEIFKGNPAAVCILDSKLPEEIMLKIAQENNLSETAFAIKNGDYYDLRWFTPKAEIELCGHAALATSFILKNFYEPKANTFKFKTLSGILSVSTQDNLLSMDFPTIEIKEISQNPEFKKAIGKNVSEAYLGADLILVLNNEEDIFNLKPNQDQIKELPGLCLHVTAKSKKYDCITRTFAPKCNIVEDPVCGRAHAHLIQIWAKKLNKNNIHAYQASSRGGELFCTYNQERTIISGYATLYSSSDLNL